MFILFKMSNLNNIEINKVCRTCLTAAEDMKSLYEANSTSKQISLAELLMSCTPLKCFKNDGLPTTICYNCIEDLQRCDTFQSKCLESETTLRNHDYNHFSKTIKLVENPISITDSFHCSNKIIEPKYPILKSLKQECEEDTNENSRIFEEVFVNTEFPVRLENTNLKTVRSLIDPLTIAEISEDMDQKLDLIKHEVDMDLNKSLSLIGDQSINTNRIINCDGNKSQTGEKQYSCTVCNTPFKLMKYLKSHMRKHSSEKPYSCTLCSSAFGYKQNLDVHMRTHSGERPYPCTTCDNSFITTQQLKYHMRTHTGEKPYTCKMCNLGFAYRQSFKLHMRTHSGEKPYTCTDCNVSFGLKHTLTTHMRTHTEEKPYSCTVCDSSFKQGIYLKAHMRRHAGAKLYTCTVCDKSFKQSRSLTTHMRIHTGEKPYPCTICVSSFATKPNLTYHMLTHTGEKPYTCTVCNKTFKIMWQLQRHMGRHIREKQ